MYCGFLLSLDFPYSLLGQTDYIGILEQSEPSGSGELRFLLATRKPLQDPSGLWVSNDDLVISAVICGNGSNTEYGRVTKK